MPVPELMADRESLSTLPRDVAVHPYDSALGTSDQPGIRRLERFLEHNNPEREGQVLKHEIARLPEPVSLPDATCIANGERSPHLRAWHPRLLAPTPLAVRCPAEDRERRHPSPA